MEPESSNGKSLWKVVSHAAVGTLFGLLSASLFASITLWRDFSRLQDRVQRHEETLLYMREYALVKERQDRMLERLTAHEVVMTGLGENIHIQQSANADQQFQLNQHSLRLRGLERLFFGERFGDDK